MSRDRWHVIKWCLSAVDPGEDAPRTPPTSGHHDRCWKARPFLQALAHGSRASVQVGRTVTLDEMMVKCKGVRLATSAVALQNGSHSVCYLQVELHFGAASPPSRFVMESRFTHSVIPTVGACTGRERASVPRLVGFSFEFFLAVGRFTYRFLVHDWVPEDRRTPQYVDHRPYTAGTAALVLWMASQLPSTNHTIVMDNWFASVKAFRGLAAAGFHALGTVKSNSGVSKEMLWPKMRGSRQVGAARALRSGDRKLVLQEWQDSALVRVLSTWHKGISGNPDRYVDHPGVKKVHRWQRVGLQWQRVQRPCPPAVVAYQETMRGVDIADAVSIVHCLCVQLGVSPTCLHHAETGSVHHSHQVQALVPQLVLLRP